MRILRAVPFLVALAALLGAEARPARAADPPTIGVGSHQLDARSVAALRDLGIRQVRTTLYMPLWENDPAWRREFDAGVERARRAGLELLVVVHEPSGARMGAAEREEQALRMTRFMETVARHYRGTIRHWQLWNEMDTGFTDAFGAVSGLPMRERGRLYARQLARAYPAVKRGNPDAVVVTGGLASVGDDLREFLRGMREGEARFDVLALHTYGVPLVEPFRRKAATARREYPGAELWCTEFGIEKSQIPWPEELARWEEYQRRSWREVAEANEAEGIYARAYGHVLWDGEAESHAILRKDFSARPAYHWLRERLRPR